MSSLLRLGIALTLNFLICLLIAFVFRVSLEHVVAYYAFGVAIASNQNTAIIYEALTNANRSRD